MSTPPPVSFAQALRFWAWLGCVSFGGPAGQIALMHRELVERRRWISAGRFAHALNYCLVLPGPEAQQLATYLGWLMHQTRGGLAAGLLFVLPSWALMVLLAWAYLRWGQHPWGQALLWGLQPAVLALVCQALWRLSRRSLHGPVPWALAALGVLGMALGWPFVGLMAAGAALGMLVRAGPAASATRPPASAPPQARASGAPPAWLDDHTPLPAHAQATTGHWRRALAWGLAGGGAVWGALALHLGPGHALVQMAQFFTQAALVTFGGAYAVLPYVTQTAVAAGWLNPAQMMDGLALGESTPGPLIMVVAFVGYLGGHQLGLLGDPLWGGLAGAAVATAFTFLPSFVFILAGAPWVERTRQLPALQAPLQGMAAVVAGLMLHLAGLFALHTLWPQGLDQGLDGAALALATLAAWLLLRRDWPFVRVLLLCLALGTAGHSVALV